MKVGIIGATGKAGRLIAKEAYERGHQVTAIVIDPEHLDNQNYTILNKNVFDLTVDDVKDFDVVINCFGVFDPAKLIQHQTSMKALIYIFEQLPNVRFMMIGGAASLYTDETKTKLVLETIPDDWAGVPKNMKAAFEELKQSKVNWTYFSPAGTFDPDGARTGKYVIGDNDVAILNEDGESYISYADYAVAMVDEMENKKYTGGKRITAVSRRSSKPEEAASPAVSRGNRLTGKEPSFEGLSQWLGAFCYELAGKAFHLVMDNGYEYLLRFTDGTTLMWAEKGKDFVSEHYECVKGEETVYFVNVEMSHTDLRTGISLILDTETNLVTMAIVKQGTNPKFPTLITQEFVFGAIKMDGEDLPFKRHGYTSDLVGTRIHWAYHSDFALTHVYYDPNFIRATNFEVPGMSDAPPPSPEVLAQMRENPYDEPCAYIKIRNGLYLISFIEQHLVLRGKIGNNMMLLVDTKRLHDVGRSFGLAQKPDGTIGTENYFFAAIGEWEENDGTVENEESKYIV